MTPAPAKRTSAPSCTVRGPSAVVLSITPIGKEIDWIPAGMVTVSGVATAAGALLVSHTVSGCDDTKSRVSVTMTALAPALSATTLRSRASVSIGQSSSSNVTTASAALAPGALARIRTSVAASSRLS